MSVAVGIAQPRGDQRRVEHQHRRIGTGIDRLDMFRFRICNPADIPAQIFRFRAAFLPLVALHSRRVVAVRHPSKVIIHVVPIKRALGARGLCEWDADIIAALQSVDHRGQCFCSELNPMSRLSALAMNPIRRLAEDDIADLAVEALLGCYLRFGHALHEFRLPGFVAV